MIMDHFEEELQKKKKKKKKGQKIAFWETAALVGELYQGVWRI